MNPLDRMDDINIDEWIQEVKELTAEIHKITSKSQTIEEEWEKVLKNTAGEKESAEANNALKDLNYRRNLFCGFVGGKRIRRHSRNKRTRKNRR